MTTKNTTTKLLFVLLCTGLYFGCDSADLTGEPAARTADEAPVGALQVLPGAADATLRRGPKGRDEACNCSDKQNDQLLFDTTRAYQFFVDTDGDEETIEESYTLVLHQLAEGRAVLALYRLNFVAQLCREDDFTAYRFVRYLSFVPKQKVDVTEIGIELTWQGRILPPRSEGGEGTIFIKKNTDPKHGKDPRVPTEPPGPGPVFYCLIKAVLFSDRPR